MATWVSPTHAVSPLGSSRDVMDQPSLLTPLALKATMLSVARSGPRLVAVGERGIVLTSEDDGQHWTQVPVPVSTTLTQVAFFDAQRGWAVGHSGIVLATQDGGVHWQRLFDGRQAAALQLAAAKVSGDPKRIRAAELLQTEGADKPFLALHVQDATTVRVVGAYGLAFMTRDGGQHWQSLMEAVDNPKGRHLYAIARAGMGVVIAGEQGQISRSEQDAERFENLGQQGLGSFFGLLTSPQSMLAYGLRGALYRSNNGGRAWEKVAMPPLTISTGVALSDGGLLLVNEAGQRLRSDDGGRSFTVLPGAPTAPISAAVQAADGSLILAGVGGMSRIPVAQLNAKEARK